MFSNANPTSILFLDHASALGGAEQSLLLLLRYLDRQRFRPLLACNPGPLADAARGLGVPTLPVTMPKLRGNPAALRELTRGSLALAQYIRRERVALIHSNVMRASFYALLAARLTGRPLIWHVRDIHAPGQPGGTWYPRLMCRLSNRVITISRAVAAALPCCTSARIIYNGVDLSAFDPHLDGAAVRAELGIVHAIPLVGILGRVQPWKGQADFLRAAALVAQTHPAAHFIVIGDTIFATERDYLQELRELAHDLGITDRVTFTGYRHDIPRLLAALDLLVHCSQAEPFGRVLIEAMAMARPIVAYADGGVPEIVLDGETGRLVPPGDTTALAHAIVDLLDHPEQADAMGQAGRSRVTMHFDAHQTARAIEKIYESLLK